MACNVSRDTVAVSNEIAAPSTSSPATQARQIRSASRRSPPPSRTIASNDRLRLPEEEFTPGIVVLVTRDGHLVHLHR